MPGRRTYVLAKWLIHGPEVLPFEDAARVVLDNGGHGCIHGHPRLEAVGDVRVDEGSGAVAVVIVAQLVCFGDDVVKLLLPVDRELHRPQAEVLRELQAAVMHLSDARVFD